MPYSVSGSTIRIGAGALMSWHHRPLTRAARRTIASLRRAGPSRIASTSARIMYFALLAESHAGAEYYRPQALYGFVVDDTWINGSYSGELIPTLRRAEIGTRYEVALRPGARLEVRYRVDDPLVSSLQVGDRREARWRWHNWGPGLSRVRRRRRT